MHDAEADRWGRLKTKVELVTGGYSSDEHLLHRVSTNVYVGAAWRSTHAGGLYVYEFDQSWMTSRDELVWLAPDTGLFNSSYRARVLRIEQVDGGVAEFAFPGGVEMLFTEPDRDILEPAGVLTVRAAPEFDLLPSRAIASEKVHADEVPTIDEIAEAFGIELEPDEKPTPKPRPRCASKSRRSSAPADEKGAGRSAASHASKWTASSRPPPTSRLSWRRRTCRSQPRPGPR